MEIYTKENNHWNVLQTVAGMLSRIKERIGSLNSGQKKVFWGLVFFMLINALILVISIVVFTKLINKL